MGLTYFFPFFVLLSKHHKLHIFLSQLWGLRHIPLYTSFDFLTCWKMESVCNREKERTSSSLVLAGCIISYGSHFLGRFIDFFSFINEFYPFCSGKTEDVGNFKCSYSKFQRAQDCCWKSPSSFALFNLFRALEISMVILHWVLWKWSWKFPLSKLTRKSFCIKIV